MSRILIIDDEKSIRSSLKEILEYEKFETDDATNGTEGLELIKSKKYDVILCDIKMPVMDGIEVLENIMKMTDTPVVMISGHGNIETAVEAIKKGAFDYIAKPLEPEQVINHDKKCS